MGSGKQWLGIFLVLVGHKALAAQLPSSPVLILNERARLIVAEDAPLEVLAEGFSWSEGPVVEPNSGDVLFSDVPENKLYRWNAVDGLSLYLHPSGDTGRYSDNPAKQGSNGLMFNQQQQLVLAQHGDRRLAVLEGVSDHTGRFRTLTDRFEDKRFNSPNDVVQHSNGSYYFTDPPYGLAGGDNSPAKALSVNGVYRFNTDGKTSLLVNHLSRPNGLAFSPDERWLYLANSDKQAAQWWRYAVHEDGSLDEGALWLDATDEAQQYNGLPDGLKVLPSGVVLATGPRGVWIIDPDGTPLGIIQTGVSAANVALSPNYRWLYITASQYLLRLALLPSESK